MRYKDQINIKLYSYINGAFILQAIIDDYQEISFSHNLYEAGDFTITINYNIPNSLKFERGMFIQFGNDAYMFGEILRISDAIGADGKGSQIRTITGKDSRYIFKRRIIKNLNNEENWAMTAKGEICLRELIKAQCGSGAEAKRQLPITNTIPSSSNAIGKEYSVAESFSNLYDTLVTIATQSEIGWRIKFDGSLTLECFEGSDLSSQVQFSTDFDSLANGEFTDSAESFANTIYVGGKGTGSDRDIYEGESAISGNSPSGFDRFEAWDNQSSMTVESEYEAEALSMLTQYGQTINVSGQGLAVCPYIFKEQYDIGDTITLAFSGKSAKAQILSVTEHWVWGEYGIEFSFGKPQNDLARQLQLILKQIQKASNKTTTTSSVKYYTIPTDTQMPKADVIYDTIGFIGDVGNGATFQLYLDDEKTGAKTYHVWFKQLAGSGKLTLTTGKAGATNLVMNSGTYVAIIYVDAQGNITMAGATTTNIISANNNQPASSEAVANYKTDSVTSGSDLPVTSGAVAQTVQEIQTVESSLPTDAVLHYSFDEVPDYPDGTADVRLLNNNTYDIQDTDYKFYNNGGATLSNENGNLKVAITGGSSTGVYINGNFVLGKIIKIKITVSQLTGKLRLLNGISTVFRTISEVGTYEIIHYHNNSEPTYTALYMFCNGTGNSCTFTVEKIYIGGGSYSTPIIDNSGNGTNATNNSGLAAQGVSGKGVYFLTGANHYVSCNFNFADNFSISCFVKPSNSTSLKRQLIFRKRYALVFVNGGGNVGDNSLFLYFYDENGTATSRTLSTLLPSSVFSHVCLTKEGTSLKCYVNGVLQSTNILPQYINKNNEVLTIGGDTANSTRESTIDDFLIFNRALSEAEVMALYLNRGNTPKYYSWADWKLSQV